MVAHNRKKLQRLAAVIGAALMQSSFGGIYAWYFLAPALFDQSGKHGLSTTQVHWIFSTALLFIAGAAVFTGKLVDRFSPRSVAVASGILFGSGFIFTAFFGCTFPLQLIFIGLVAGCGVGLGCVIPIAVGFNWFPDNKGI